MMEVSDTCGRDRTKNPRGWTHRSASCPAGKAATGPGWSGRRGLGKGKAPWLMMPIPCEEEAGCHLWRVWWKERGEAIPRAFKQSNAYSSNTYWIAVTYSDSTGNYKYVHILVHAAAAKLLQSCPTLCDPMNGSPPGSPVPGILQASTLEWVAISFSIAWKWKVKVKSFSRVQLLRTPWTAAYQPPPSMGFAMQEYWSGLPLPSPLTSKLCF